MQKAPFDAGFRSGGVQLLGDSGARRLARKTTVHLQEVGPLRSTPFRSENNRIKRRDRLPVRHLLVQADLAPPATNAAVNVNRS
jgi:hypothetical protein